MGTLVVRISPEDERYFMWSTGVDCPVTSVMNRDEIRDYLHTYQRHSIPEMYQRLERADKNGCSEHLGFLWFDDEEIFWRNAPEGLDIGKPFQDDEDDEPVPGIRLVSREELVEWVLNQ